MTDNLDVNIVNIVGSGNFQSELALEALSNDLEQAEYNPENYHGLYIRFGDEQPLTTVYRSGKYIITGGSSIEELMETRKKVQALFENIGAIDNDVSDNFTIQNFVCQADIEDTINLTALAVALGLEQVEYEPEQFPGLVFRPQEYECVLLIFGSGKVIVTGSKSVKEANSAFHHFRQKMKDL